MRFTAAWFLILAGSTSLMALAIGDRSSRNVDEQEVLAEQGHRVWGLAVHDSEFGSIGAAIRSDCASVRPPQPLATPDPQLDELVMNSTLTVSFIVGTDGQVASALVLDGAGAKQDRSALATVRRWRYRPALCDGVPVEAEARVKFCLCHERAGCPVAGTPAQYLSEQYEMKHRGPTDQP